MKNRIVSLLLALALLVLPVVSAGAAQPAAAETVPVQTQTDAAAESAQHCYSYIALGDSIVAGIGLPDAVYHRNGRYYDVSGNYQGYSKDCYVARVADSLGLSRDQTANYGMPALMSSDLLELVRTGSCQSASMNFVLPNLRQELKDAEIITVEIGANDVLVPIMYGVAAAMGGPQVFEALLPMLEGDFRQMDASSFAALRENLDSLNITAQQRKALLQLLSSGVADICAQSQATTLANIEALLQELKALNPNAQIVLVGYYNPLPLLPAPANPFVKHFRTLSRSVQKLAQQYDAAFAPATYYVALGDSITTGVGLKDAHFSSTAKSYDVQENYHGYSKDCYVARVADALGLDRDHAVNYGMPAAMSSNILDLVRTGSTASGVAYYDLPTLRQELADADLITLLIGSNDTVLQLMGAMGRATNGKATKLLIPLLTGTMRELNLQTLQTLRKGLENLDLTPEELKAALKLLDSGMEEICDQTRDQTVANVEQILQELRALNPDAQIILVGYYNPLPFLPTYGRHFRLLNRSVKALAQQYGADYVSIPYTSIANDGHPTVCGHKYIARQILKAVRK